MDHPGDGLPLTEKFHWLQKLIPFGGRRESWTSYLIAIGLMVVALGVRLAIAPISAGLQYVTFFPAVTFAALIGGYRAGLLATSIGLVFATCILTPPYFSISMVVLHKALWSNIVFLIDGLILSFTIDGMHFYRLNHEAELERSLKAHIDLEERESRWKIAIDATGAGLWDWDIPNGSVYLSPLWKQMIGYSEEEIGAELNEWESRLHPEDKAATLEVLMDCLDDKIAIYSSEHRFRCKDGSYKWMFDRGVVIRRDTDGKPLRMIGMHTDITQRKENEAALRLSEETLRAVTDNVELVMFLKDAQSRYLYVNRQYEKLFHVTNADMLGKTDHDIFPQAMADAFTNNDKLVVERGQTIEVEEQVQHDDGVHIYTSVKIPVRKATEEVYAVCGIATDITKRKMIETDLRIAATVFESQEAMMITDANNLILRVNRAFTNITGYTEEEVIGQPPSILQSGRHDAEFYRTMWQSILQHGSWQGEVWDRRKDGEVYPKWLTISVVKDADGNISHFIGTHHDITEQKRAEEKIKELAFFDSLTRLPNRTLFRDRLQQAMIVGNRDKAYAALLFVDLDHFKTLNDSMGHDKGDLLLVQVAERLSSCVREGDTVARLGGDEFVIVLKRLHEELQEAATLTETVGEKILASINQGYQLGGISYHPSASIGATLFLGDKTPIDDLLKQADIAMYKAKDAGRNTLRFFDTDMEIAVMKRVSLEHDLHEAILQGQFLLHYQPQMAGGQPIGSEALIRWLHPKRGMVAPDDFISLAEDTGLILPLGHWVLETACAQLAAWSSQPDMAHLTVAVNVSAKQFHQPDFVNQVLAVLKTTGPTHDVSNWNSLKACSPPTSRR